MFPYKQTNKQTNKQTERLRGHIHTHENLCFNTNRQTNKEHTNIANVRFKKDVLQENKRQTDKQIRVETFWHFF